MTDTILGPARKSDRSSVMTTGPSGLVLGHGPAGPVAVRLFRPEPTRVFMATPDYLKWLISFRAVCLGAHLSIISGEHRGWLTLADTIRACGGTVDLLRSIENVPGQGRPFRPSLIVDELGKVTTQTRLGAWQALISVGDPTQGKAVNDMRNSDLTMISPVEGKAADSLRRAYALGSNQMKLTAGLGESDLILASVRRLVKVPVPPSPTEYRLLFGG